MIVPTSLTRSPSRTSLLDNLPPELIVYITDFLPPSSITCLSLTRKPLYNSLQQRCSTKLDTDQERFSFLNCLARDLPEYIPCHGRGKSKLYLWRHQQNGFYHCDHCLQNVNYRIKYRRAEHHVADASGVPMYTICGGIYHRVLPVDCLTFGLRTLVLRHELLGPEYGVSVSKLDCAVTRGDIKHDRRSCKIKATPKIVREGNLMIYKTVNYHSTYPMPMVSENLICPHAQEEAYTLTRMASGGSGTGDWELVTAAIAGSRNPFYSQVGGKDPEQVFNDIEEAESQWHHYPKLLKCEYCATDARFFVRKVRNSPVRDCFEYRFEVYHDFGNLYQPMTIPQRQLIEVATSIPKIQALYPSTLEFHERLHEDLETKFHEPVPLNIRGTAMNTMQHVTQERRQTILNLPFPKHVSLLPPGGRRSHGFKEMVGKCGMPVPCSCPADIWFEQQMDGDAALGLKLVAARGRCEV